ncbi:MAG: VPS10 domain-containing protein, partial [Blastocatellia bacterium]
QWRAISSDLSDPAGDERAVVPTGTITMLAESRFAPGILYAGTESGKLYLTRDDGKNWKNISAGLPKKWISRIVASDYDAATVYVSLTGYRADDFTAYLYRSTDYGATWTSIANNLPAESINVVREDPQNANLLYLGTDAGVYVSLDRGAHWQSLCADLPTTPVHDLVIHPREHELIIATHGRSMFLMDIRPLQALNDQVRAAELHVFDVRPVKLKWAAPREVPPFPPRGRARIHYWLKQSGNVTLTVRNAEGETIRTLQTKGVTGVNDAVWDIRNESGRDQSSGVYQVTVTAGSREIATPVTVKP